MSKINHQLWIIYYNSTMPQLCIAVMGSMEMNGANPRLFTNGIHFEVRCHLRVQCKINTKISLLSSCYDTLWHDISALVLVPECGESSQTFPTKYLRGNWFVYRNNCLVTRKVCKGVVKYILEPINASIIGNMKTTLTMEIMTKINLTVCQSRFLGGKPTI